MRGQPADVNSNQSCMIDGLLEQTHRKIKLDRVLLENGTLSTDETEINDRVTSYFQNVATLNSNSQDIPNEWELDYAPLPIDDNIYNGQLSKIILDELNEILSECPNNKAAGVSNITYELIKLSSKHY